MRAKQLVRGIEKPALKAAEKIDSNKKMESLARFGFIVNGVLHGLIGATAIGVALGGGNGEIDQSAVLEPLGTSVIGIVILLLLSIGFIMLGFWKAVQIVLTKKARITRTRAYQLEEAFKAVVYILLGVTSAVFIFSHDSTNESIRASQQIAAAMLKTPVGVVAICALGLVLIGVGGNFVYRGASRRFLRSVDTPPEKVEKIVVSSGIVGYISKGLVFVSLGIVFLVSGITADPSKASGLDGAFKMFFKLPFGAFILFIVGLGFLLYALYSFSRARYGHFRVKRNKYL